MYTAECHCTIQSGAIGKLCGHDAYHDDVHVNVLCCLHWLCRPGSGSGSFISGAGSRPGTGAAATPAGSSYGSVLSLQPAEVNRDVLKVRRPAVRLRGRWLPQLNKPGTMCCQPCLCMVYVRSRGGGQWSCFALNVHDAMASTVVAAALGSCSNSLGPSILK